jgi:hypothetical protein
MEAASATFSPERPKAFRAILWGGLTAGVLDLTAACVNNGLKGRTPIRVMQSISSGLLGADAFTGGMETAVLGLLLHFLIATVAASVYYAASRKLKFLAQKPIVCGLFYGIVVYGFMNMVVLPLSAVPFNISYTPAVLVNGLIIHMLFVGLPIALCVRRYSK